MKKSAKREKKPAAPENEKNLSGKGFSQKKMRKSFTQFFSSWIRGCRLFLSFGRLFHVDLPQNYNRK